MMITQIEVFVKIAQLKNFTKAGDCLGMTQSAVSHSVSKLENNLNVKLFNRSKTEVILTPVGENIYEYMKEVLKNLELIHFEVSNTVKLEAATLRIGTFQSIAASLLPKVIKLFNQIYPQIEFTIFEGTEQEIIKWIKNDTVDLGFISLPSEEFDTTYIIQDEILVVLPENHKLSKLKKIDVNQLKDEDLIMPVNDCDILKSGKTRDILIDVKYRISNFNTIVEMVKEQLGITIFPKLTLNNTSNDRISTRSFNPPFYRNIGLASKDNISNNLLKKVFAEKIKHIVEINKLG